MNEFFVWELCRALGLRAGAIIFRGVTIADASIELRSQINDEVKRIRREYKNPAAIRSLPEIAKQYEILRNVGVKPRSHPPSTQKLLEFALKRGTLPAVNNLVDAYNLVSIRTKCSLGAHDLDRISVPVALRLFVGDESFRPLGSNDNQPVTRGEFGYVDAEQRVLCRLDSLQSDFSKVTAETTNVLLIVETTTVHESDRLECVFAETESIVLRQCGGTAEVVLRPFWRPQPY